MTSNTGERVDHNTRSHWWENKISREDAFPYFLQTFQGIEMGRLKCLS